MNSVNIVEIIFAIFIVLLLTFIAYVVYNKEVLNSFSQNNVRRKEQIFEGILDFGGAVKSVEIDTFDKNASSFLDLSPSVNQEGGAEYSYNFWLYLDQDKFSTVSDDYTIFLRGNKVKVPYTNDSNCILKRKGEYYLVKNPLLRLTGDGSALLVEYNTLTSPDSFREYGKNSVNCNSRKMYEKNNGLLGVYDLNKSMYDKRWFMMTIVLKETNPNNDILYKNKTSCKIYLNGVTVLDRYVESPYNGSYGSTTMKHNRGKLYVNLDNEIANENKIKIANLTYFNYGLDTKQITDLYNEKFPVTAVKVTSDYQDGKEISFSRTDDNNMPKPF